MKRRRPSDRNQPVIRDFFSWSATKKLHLLNAEVRLKSILLATVGMHLSFLHISVISKEEEVREERTDSRSDSEGFTSRPLASDVG